MVYTVMPSDTSPHGAAPALPHTVVTVAVNPFGTLQISAVVQLGAVAHGLLGVTLDQIRVLPASTARTQIISSPAPDSQLAL